jgi:uncharacterized protein (UPF0371 family)
MAAVHSASLFYCKARWFSRGIFLQCVYELKDEVAIFLEKKSEPEAAKFRNDLCICDEIELLGRHLFEKLNTLNLQLQGPNIHTLDTSDKVNAFCRKLELWRRNLKHKT